MPAIEEMTFGVEMEITLPSERMNQIYVGGRHHGAQVPGLPDGWNAQRDGSIRGTRTRFGVEIVSPVLRGADGIRQIVTVCAQLNAWGAKVNDSCGFHVHVGFDRSDVKGLQKLIHMTAAMQDGIWAATGTKGRERGRWSRGIREDFRALNYASGDVRTLGYAAGDRYHVLNVSNLMHASGKPTVEFRAFAGTTNAGKVIAYVRLCLGLVERALEASRARAFDAKPLTPKSPMARKGAGYSALTRLLYAVGWVKGRCGRAYGAVGAEVEGLPGIEQSKSELRRLAKKYDAAS